MHLAFFLTSFRDSPNYGNFFSYESEKFPLTSEIYYIARRWHPSEVRENVLLHKHVYGVKKCTSNYDRERHVFRANKPSSVLEFPYRSLYLSGSVSLFHHYLSSNCSIICFTSTSTIDNLKKARISVVDLHENS